MLKSPWRSVQSRRQAFELAQSGSSIIIDYLIKDLFSTDIPAGSLDGTSAEIGTRATADTGNLMSTSGGELVIADGGAGADPQLRYIETNSGITAVAGLCVKASVRCATNANLINHVGYDNAASGAVAYYTVSFGVSGNINVKIGSNTIDTTYDYVADTDYEVATIFTPTLFCVVIKGGAFADWTVIDSRSQTQVSGAATTYPLINAYNRESYYKYLEVAILPAPWDSDSVVAGDVISSDGKRTLNAMTSNSALWTGSTLKELFKSLGEYVGIARNGDDYLISQDLGDDLEWCVNLAWDSAINSLKESQVFESGVKKKTCTV